MVRLPDVEHAIRVLRAIATAPTVPNHEHHALRAIERALTGAGIATTRDGYGQVFAHLSSGGAKRPIALVAHTDHPGFEIVEAHGKTGRVRVLGGLPPRVFVRPIPVIVHHDEDGHPPIRAQLDGFVPGDDAVQNSAGTLAIAAEAPIQAGLWAVLDVPPFTRDGDELHLRAADDLAGCAMAVLAAQELARETRPYDVHLLFTRAEETGLYGARIAAEDGTIPANAYVISIEASRELPSAMSGQGIVVRAGDYHNTFSNEAERALRVGRERLAGEGVPTQRALLTGGTCEASAFVRLGYLATGMALPNVNYHNVSPDDRLVPEVVRLSDLRSGVALLVEAAVAAAEDSAESWWPTNRVVPDAVRRLLSRNVR